jgi:uncharacterized membrane protein YeiB
VGVAITVLVGALTLTDQVARPWLWRPVTAVGSMSLTAYVLHIIAVGGLGLSAQQGEPLLGFIAGTIGFALVWSRFHRCGPLEFLLTKATERSQRLSS